jgi:hypothetical protein
MTRRENIHGICISEHNNDLVLFNGRDTLNLKYYRHQGPAPRPGDHVYIDNVGVYDSDGNTKYHAIEWEEVRISPFDYLSSEPALPVQPRQLAFVKKLFFLHYYYHRAKCSSSRRKKECAYSHFLRLSVPADPSSEPSKALPGNVWDLILQRLSLVDFLVLNMVSKTLRIAVQRAMDNRKLILRDVHTVFDSRRVQFFLSQATAECLFCLVGERFHYYNGIDELAPLVSPAKVCKHCALKGNTDVVTVAQSKIHDLHALRNANVPALGMTKSKALMFWRQQAAPVLLERKAPVSKRPKKQ